MAESFYHILIYSSVEETQQKKPWVAKLHIFTAIVVAKLHTFTAIVKLHLSTVIVKKFVNASADVRRAVKRGCGGQEVREHDCRCQEVQEHGRGR